MPLEEQVPLEERVSLEQAPLEEQASPENQASLEGMASDPPIADEPISPELTDSSPEASTEQEPDAPVQPAEVVSTAVRQPAAAASKSTGGAAKSTARAAKSRLKPRDLTPVVASRTIKAGGLSTDPPVPSRPDAESETTAGSDEAETTDVSEAETTAGSDEVLVAGSFDADARVEATRETVTAEDELLEVNSPEAAAPETTAPEAHARQDQAQDSEKPTAGTPVRPPRAKRRPSPRPARTQRAKPVPVVNPDTPDAGVQDATPPIVAEADAPALTTDEAAAVEVNERDEASASPETPDSDDDSADVVRAAAEGSPAAPDDAEDEAASEVPAELVPLEESSHPPVESAASHQTSTEEVAVEEPTGARIAGAAVAPPVQETAVVPAAAFDRVTSLPVKSVKPNRRPASRPPGRPAVSTVVEGDAHPSSPRRRIIVVASALVLALAVAGGVTWFTGTQGETPAGKTIEQPVPDEPTAPDGVPIPEPAITQTPTIPFPTGENLQSTPGDFFQEATRSVARGPRIPAPVRTTPAPLRPVPPATTTPVVPGTPASGGTPVVPAPEPVDPPTADPPPAEPPADPPQGEDPPPPVVPDEPPVTPDEPPVTPVGAVLDAAVGLLP